MAYKSRSEAADDRAFSILRGALNAAHNAVRLDEFAVTLDGRQLCISRQPLLDAARILTKEGIDPATPIAARYAGAGFNSMTSTVGAAAKWTVRETKPSRRPSSAGGPFPPDGSSRRAFKRTAGP